LIDFTTIFGIGFVFGLSFMFTVISTKSISGFILWLCIFIGFAVWFGLLPLWTLILNVIAVIVIMIMKIKNYRSNV